MKDLQNFVFETIKKAGALGATTLELEGLTRIARVSISPRIAPLVKLGKVRDSGTRRTSAGSTRSSTVWIAA